MTPKYHSVFATIVRWALLVEDPVIGDLLTLRKYFWERLRSAHYTPQRGMRLDAYFAGFAAGAGAA